MRPIIGTFLSLFCLLSLLRIARAEQTNVSIEIGFDRIVHGWTNYSTAFNSTHDLAPSGEYATVGSFYTPTQDVRLLDYGAIVVWSGSGGQRFSFTNFSFAVAVWSDLEAFTHNPSQGDVASYSFDAPTGGSLISPDATTRGGRPAYEIRFCLTNHATILTNGGTWLVGLFAKAFVKSSGELFIPTSSHAGGSDVQAGSLVVGGSLNLVDGGGTTIYDGQLATALLVHPLAPPRFHARSSMETNGFRVFLTVEPEVPLVLQRSEDLRAWEDWYSTIPKTNLIEVLDPSATASSTRFYRARSP